MADQAVWEGHGRQQTADMRISGTTGWNLGPHQKWLARRGSTSTFQAPGFWSHSCRMDVNFPMGRCFFFSHFFTPGSVSQLSCSDVSGPFEAVEHLWPEAPWKSGGDCRSEGIFFLQKWWNTCDICDIWDSLSSAPNPSSWHGVLRVLLPWFHTRDLEQNATMGPSDCQPSSFGILVTLVVVWKSSTLKLDGGQDLWVWVPWLVTKFNVISVTSTYFFIPSIGTSDFRMAQFPPVVWGLTLW